MQVCVRKHRGVLNELKGKSQAQTENIVSEKAVKYQQKETYFDEGGTFQPLSVWKAQGFNVDDIVAKSAPCDVREHKVLGKTYRVSLLGIG